MPTIKTLVVPADDEQDIYVLEMEQGDTDKMREVVGGWYGASEGREIDVTFWYHDEGKIIDLPVNNRATCMWWSADRRFLRFDYLAGDVLITGMADRNGDTLGCPDDFLELVLKDEDVSFSVHAHGQVVMSMYRGSYIDALTNGMVLAQVNGIIDQVKVYANS